MLLSYHVTKKSNIKFWSFCKFVHILKISLKTVKRSKLVGNRQTMKGISPKIVAKACLKMLVYCLRCIPWTKAACYCNWFIANLNYFLSAGKTTVEAVNGAVTLVPAHTCDITYRLVHPFFYFFCFSQHSVLFDRFF